MSLEDKFAHFHNTLLQTCEGSEYADGTTLGKIHILLKLTSQLLDASNVSVWGFSKDRSKFICRTLYDRDKDEFSKGTVLATEDYPNYFQTLSTNRVIVAHNARSHPATAEFTESYFTPLGIHSLVDTPVYSSSGQHGILCVEDKQQNRQWGVDETSLIVAVADKISLAIEHEAWRKASDQVHHAQRRDTFTGLENRFGFQERIEATLAEPDKKVEHNNYAVLVISVDRFTSLNDLMSYNQVNQLLKTLAEELTELAQTEHCFPARISAGNFALWAPELDSELVELIQKVQQLFNREIRLSDDAPTEISASVGAVNFTDDLHESDNPIRKAEVALAKARESGNSSYAIFDDSWYQDYKHQKDRELALLKAVKNAELIPFYQPIVDAKTGSIVGAEALIRWNDPARGILSPFHFLPLATEMGIMSQLGELMLRTVCEDISSSAELQSLSWVSVNLSSEQLYSNTLVSLITSLLSHYQIPRGMLELEIVEELISYDVTQVTDQLNALDELGISLSIDDFGTGYSSLSRLKHLPVSKLKIDRSFVDGLPDDDSDSCISSSIIGMASGLHLDVVAEGVETEAQANWLKAHDCAYIQGFLYAKPMPLEQLQTFIHQSEKAKKDSVEEK